MPRPVMAHCIINPVKTNDGHAPNIIQENQQGGGMAVFKEILSQTHETIDSFSTK